MSMPFEIETDLAGSRIVVTREPLHPACLSDAEVDFHLNVLMDQLEKLRPAMKKAIRKLAATPMFDLT